MKAVHFPVSGLGHSGKMSLQNQALTGPAFCLDTGDTLAVGSADESLQMARGSGHSIIDFRDHWPYHGSSARNRIRAKSGFP